MAAGTIRQTKLMDRIAVVAAAVTQFTGRVYQGYKYFADGDTRHIDAVKNLTAETQGYFAFTMVRWTKRGRTGIGNLELRGRVWIKVSQYADNNLNVVFETVDALMEALNNEANFDTGTEGPAKPTEVTAALNEEDSNPSDGIMVFDVTGNYETGLTCT